MILSKNAVRRAAYTATAEVEEEHVTLPKWCKQELRRCHSALKPAGRAFQKAVLGKLHGIKRKVVVKRGRFLIGQYLDRSKYNGDGSKKDVAVQN